MSSNESRLPKGQKSRPDFPRFGLPAFANRWPKFDHNDGIAVRFSGRDEFVVTAEQIATLPEIEITADFHCVTTWSVHDLTWRGVLFRQFFETTIVPKVSGAQLPEFLVFHAHDGYRACLPLRDALADRVLLATELLGASTPNYHGVPYRLVAPDHYGYKNVKSLKRIEFLDDLKEYRPSGLSFMEHPRALVSSEERARWLPGWLLRVPYRLLIKSTEARFEQAWSKFVQK